MNADDYCVVRGGGDLATGVIWRLHRCGIRVVVTELAHPLTIRRTVAVSTAVSTGSTEVEGMRAELVTQIDQIDESLRRGCVPVVVAPSMAEITDLLSPTTIVDARLAKRSLDTSMHDAPLVIGLGPGFTAGANCHAVVETNRGHRLGRVLWTGSAQADTGTPGVIHGRGAERVLRAPVAGSVTWLREIGERVCEGERIGAVVTLGHKVPITAPFDGMLRGAIAEGTEVHEGLKVADIDPRIDPTAWMEISDKALAIGGGVLEAVLARSAIRR